MKGLSYTSFVLILFFIVFLKNVYTYTKVALSAGVVKFIFAVLLSMIETFQHHSNSLDEALHILLSHMGPDTPQYVCRLSSKFKIT